MLFSKEMCAQAGVEDGHAANDFDRVHTRIVETMALLDREFVVDGECRGCRAFWHGMLLQRALAGCVVFGGPNFAKALMLDAASWMKDPEVLAKLMDHPAATHNAVHQPPGMTQ
jgi:hypothetical protein